MIVKAKTEYTMKLLKKFMRFNSVKNQRQIITYCFLELIMLGIVGFSNFMAITRGNSEDVTIAIIFTIIFPFIVPLIVLLWPLLTAKMSKGAIGAINLYEFSDDEIVIESSLTTANAKTNADYSYFENIYETKDAFYLYISKQQAYILSKSDIIEGNVSDLQNLFKKNYSFNKYIVKRF
jgi:hypothetical protein